MSLQIKHRPVLISTTREHLDVMKALVTQYMKVDDPMRMEIEDELSQLVNYPPAYNWLPISSLVIAMASYDEPTSTIRLLMRSNGIVKTFYHVPKNVAENFLKQCQKRSYVRPYHACVWHKLFCQRYSDPDGPTYKRKIS